MKFKFNASNWHTWSGLILALPIFIVGITAVFIGHEKSLGTKEVMVNVGWLPAYSADGKAYHYAEELKDVKAFYQDASGKQYLGTKAGLMIFDGEKVTPVDALQGKEIRSIAENNGTLYIASKYGLWVKKANHDWIQSHEGDAHGVFPVSENEIALSLGKYGTVHSTDGGITWNKSKGLEAALAQVKPEQFAVKEATSAIPLKDLVMDMHTGKAFMGKNGMWIWIDVVGLAIVGLTGTGIVMWYLRRRKKAQLVKFGTLSAQQHAA
jgi:hypothetical protein